MREMKKAFAVLLALTMAAGMASCGDSGSTSTADSTPAAESSAADETSAPETTEESSVTETEPVETEPPAPAVPDGYETVDLVSDYLGVKVSFAALNDGRFVGSEIKPNKAVDKYGRTEFAVSYYSDEEWKMQNNVKYTVRIKAIANDADDLNNKRYTPVEGSKYDGVWHDEIEDKTKCHYELYTENDSYLDGKIAVEVDMNAYADWMPMDDYKALTKTMLETMNIEVLDKNNLNDAKGNFPTASGLYTIPAKVTIAGKECETFWSVKNGAPRATVAFTNENGDSFKIMDDGQNVAKYVTSRQGDPDKHRFITIDGKTAMNDIDVGAIMTTSMLKSEYTVIYEMDGDSEINMTFNIFMGGSGDFTYDKFREKYGDDETQAELNAMFDGYAEEYVKQVIYKNGGEEEAAADSEEAAEKPAEGAPKQAEAANTEAFAGGLADDGREPGEEDTAE
ncbi:MAG: hypothetical protein IK134_02660 [Oscillospiraceae bacterium]|nr:hypothetical protein [Oscillospiraceae bacterium]